MAEEISDSVKKAFAHKEFDPHSVPIQLASTIMIVDDRPDLHVLMMRRKARSEFVGGMMVFPGGGLDAADTREAALAASYAGDAADRPYVMAAIRETFEECGVLLTVGEPPIGALAVRNDVHAETMTMGELASSFRLAFAGRAVERVGRWITPIGPPRRYDTLFFAAELPHGQEASEDDHEAEQLEWVRPNDGLNRWERGEYIMLPPTVAMLQLLQPFTSAGSFMLALRSSARDEKTTVVIGEERGKYRVVLPTDADYDPSAGRAEHGWVRSLLS